MAGVYFHVTSGEVAVSAATAKTVLQLLAAANHRVLVRGLKVFGKGVVATDTPMRVRLLRQTNAIGGSPTAATVSKNSTSDDETLQTSGTVSAGGLEPTAGDVLDVYEVHPQFGVIDPPAEPIVVKGGERLGVEVLAAQAQTVTVKLFCEE